MFNQHFVHAINGWRGELLIEDWVELDQALGTRDILPHSKLLNNEQIPSILEIYGDGCFNNSRLKTMAKVNLVGMTSCTWPSVAAPHRA